MITLKTITTIELSSLCNLKCKYCVNRLLVKHPARQPGIMSDEIFEKSLYWLDKLIKAGTQMEVHLNGNGESLLDPDIVDRARVVKALMGERYVGLCTNGLKFTQELALEFKRAEIHVDMSVHSPEHIRKAIYYHRQAGLAGVLNPGAMTMPHNWAGQLEPENCVPIEYTIQCDPLIDGRGYISSEGYVSPCCYDYRLTGAFGHVHDADLLELPITDFELCATCHQTIPADIVRALRQERIAA